MVFLYWAGIVFLLLVVFFGFKSFYSLLGLNRPPNIATPKKARQRIAELVDLRPGDRFYELGAGTARLSRALARHSSAEFIAIEAEWLTWLRARLLTAKHKNIRVIMADLLKTDLSGADYIFCFLNISIMKQLSAKASAELKPGTTLICYGISLPGHEAMLTERAGPGNIYVYRF